MTSELMKTIDFTGDSAVSINKQITLLYVWFEDSEKIWKASRKIQAGNFFLKLGSVVIPTAFSAWTSPNCSMLQGRRWSHAAADSILLCWNVNKYDLILVKLKIRKVPFVDSLMLRYFPFKRVKHAWGTPLYLIAGRDSFSKVPLIFCRVLLVINRKGWQQCHL